MQTRKKDYIDAAQYASGTLKNQQVGTLIGKAEFLKNLEKKICTGAFPTQEEIGEAKAVTGAEIFGYSEQDRIAKLNESYKHVQTELAETTDKATKFKEAIKKMARKQDKD